MLNYIIRRLLISVVVLIAIATTSFFIIQLPPGDFASTYKQFLIQNGGLTEDRAEEMTMLVRKQYGLDQPVYMQFFTWVKGIVTEGKFGYSFAYRRDAGEIILDRFPKTMMLALLAHLTSTIVGVFAGIYVAPRQYGWADNILSVIAFILTSIPRFFMALVILYLLTFTFRQSHITSFFAPEYAVAPWSWAKFVDLIKHIWPVVLVAGLGGVARNMPRHPRQFVGCAERPIRDHSPLQRAARKHRDEQTRRAQRAAPHGCLSRNRAALHAPG